MQNFALNTVNKFQLVGKGFSCVVVWGVISLGNAIFRNFRNLRSFSLWFEEGVGLLSVAALNYLRLSGKAAASIPIPLLQLRHHN